MGPENKTHLIIFTRKKDVICISTYNALLLQIILTISPLDLNSLPS